MVAAAKKPKAAAVKKPRKMTPQVAAAQPIMWADALYEWLSMGKTLSDFCREPGRPTPTVIYEKLRKDELLAARIARARDLGYDAIADECFRIADTQVLGRRTKRSDDGLEVVEEDMLGHRKLQIDTRLKLLAKWNPKKYGDKVEHEHKGGITVTSSKADLDVL